MTAPQRRMHRAARRVADQNKSLLDRALALVGLGLGSVSSVTAGGAADGNALVQVSYRGSSNAAAGYLNTYTPVANDWVLFVRVDDQLIVLGRVIGRP